MTLGLCADKDGTAQPVGVNQSIRMNAVSFS